MFASIYLSIVLSAVGFAYMTYGRKVQRFAFVLSGLVIMLFSYFIGNLILTLIIAAVLLGLPFFLERFMN